MIDNQLLKKLPVGIIGHKLIKSADIRIIDELDVLIFKKFLKKKDFIKIK